MERKAEIKEGGINEGSGSVVSRLGPPAIIMRAEYIQFWACEVRRQSSHHKLQ